MIRDSKSLLPLSPAVLHILLCLAGEQRHGYGIMQDVFEHSNGQYKLGPGTLYDNLQKLMNQGLVEEAKQKIAEDDPRRRYYQLTALGRKVLEEDVERLKHVVLEAGRRLNAARQEVCDHAISL
jgi:DNA-binding PadR family transcriptional regulator